MMDTCGTCTWSNKMHHLGGGISQWSLVKKSWSTATCIQQSLVNFYIQDWQHGHAHDPTSCRYYHRVILPIPVAWWLLIVACLSRRTWTIQEAAGTREASYWAVLVLISWVLTAPSSLPKFQATQLVGNHRRHAFKKLDNPMVTVAPERYEYHVDHDNENEVLQHIQEQIRQQSRVVNQKGAWRYGDLMMILSNRAHSWRHLAIHRSNHSLVVEQGENP